MRLIDADALKETFENTEDAEYCKWSLYGIISEIDDAPTVCDIDAIRAEIEKRCFAIPIESSVQQAIAGGLDMALKIIDRYTEEEPMDHDSVSRGYLLGLANKDGAYGYISAHEIVNAPSLNRQEPSEDAVSRQAVLDIIDKWYESNRGVENIEDLIILITYMASVRPQEQTGKWADSMEGESNG